MSESNWVTEYRIRAVFYAIYLCLLASLSGWLATRIALYDIPAHSGLTLFDKAFGVVFFGGWSTFFFFLVFGAVLDFRQWQRRKP